MTEVSALRSLLENIPQIGRVEWIGLNPARRAPTVSVAEALARVEMGLVGDHHAKSGRSKRQVTLIQFEHLAVIASLAGRADLEPNWLRRNVAVSGINLLALKDRQFRIGGAVLEGTGPCDPCSRMEEALGPGGLNAMRGHGGITARVLVECPIRIGDTVEAIARA